MLLSTLSALHADIFQTGQSDSVTVDTSSVSSDYFSVYVNKAVRLTVSGHVAHCTVTIVLYLVSCVEVSVFSRAE